MGFQTLVLLNNDQAGNWEHDTELGAKIATGMNHVNSTRFNFADLGYGRVVMCSHTSELTLALITPFNFESLAIKTQHYHQAAPTQEDNVLVMLKEYADSLGYRLVKKSKK